MEENISVEWDSYVIPTDNYVTVKSRCKTGDFLVICADGPVWLSFAEKSAENGRLSGEVEE